jgi:23S rRNA (pseudouridine1915-N3)-methyltransferase
MRLHIIARGKMGRSPEGELVDRYVKRIAWPVKITEMAENAKALPAAERNSRTVLLDEKGEQLSSVQIAEMLGRWRDDGVAEVRLCLGGADGFNDQDRASADRLIAFGKATWPHMLARAMLAEQLYRATSILANHPYHREG